MRRLVAALAGGCMLLAGVAAHAADKVMYQEITDNKPEVGVSTTVYLGDRMLEQRRGEFKDCLVPKFSVNKTQNLGMARFVIKQGEPLCKLTSGAKHYTPNYVNWTGGKNVEMTLNISLVKKGSTYNVCYSSMGFKGGCEKDKTEADFNAGPWFLYTVNSVQQTIEYAGRSGDGLKFTASQ